ncbi:MAG: transcriptional regulator [Terriglobales bacterium]
MTLGISRWVGRRLLLVLSLVLLASSSWAGQWSALGPDGGDVRSLTFDPQNPDHIFLGTSTGTVFSSNDGGHSWSRFSHLGSGDDYVIDHLAINPKNPKQIYVAAWSVENQQAGDLFRSQDSGKTWETTPALHSKSIRTMSMAASDPNVLVAGALDGVFRSKDGGKNWDKISPAGAEIKNIESLAIDPKNPDVIYAGTWHLAWKTTDGGANWQHINKGMIDDSDVFSVIVDESNPSVVFASACSGIYKSGSAGDAFQKIEGIPFSARRTRVLKQDPSHPEVVYAGTTEGLWKTADAGKTWKRVTGPEVVINDVLVDPRNSERVLLATDRSGVLASDNGAQSFIASNHGYAHRYVTAILADKQDPGTLYVGVVNDREQGGVFVSHDGGQHWTQKSAGLDGRDVFTLKQANDGDLIAGTNRGMFELKRNSSEWSPINDIVEEKLSTHAVNGHKFTTVRSVLTARVNDVEVTPSRWLAATSAGLYTSSNDGKSWAGGAVLGRSDFVSVQASEGLIVLATRSNVLVSIDDGKTWQESTGLSSYVNTIRNVTLTPDKQIMIASREGAFRSPNSGAGWEHMQNGLPDKNISSIAYDQSGNRLLATSTETGVVFESEDGGRSWHRGPDTGYLLRRISVVHGHFVGATPFDGVVVQPESENRSASASVGGATN